MSDTSTNGGPAFPRPLVGSDEAGTVDFGAEGMTLRDWFAGQVMCGLAADSECDPRQSAGYAYQVADAMLRARGHGA